jgi:hypothetical protein
MGHSVIIAVGLVITFDGADDDNWEQEFEALFARLKKVCQISSYYSPYKTEEYYLLRGVDGYDTTNKAYLFAKSSMIWTTNCDGSSTAFFHEGDGMENPETFIDRIVVANEDASTKLNALCPQVGLPVGGVKVIRFSRTYE